MTSRNQVKVSTNYGYLIIDLDRENLIAGGSHPVTVATNCNFLACNLADVDALIKGFEDIRREMTK